MTDVDHFHFSDQMIFGNNIFADLQALTQKSLETAFEFWRFSRISVGLPQFKT